MSVKKVVVYSIPPCPECKIVKEFLRKNDVKFEEIDVSAGREPVIKVSGQQSVPVTVIDGKAIVGFDTNVIGKELGL